MNRSGGGFKRRERIRFFLLTSCAMTKKRKNLFIAIGSLLVLLLLFWIFKGSGSANADLITTTVKKGEFLINVTSTGELKAKNSEDIMGPTGMRNAGVWQVKISD